LLLNSYGIARRSGFFDTSIGSALFSSAYFLYKRYEDHLADLIGSNPALVADGNILDIGANVGYTAQVLARAVQPGYVVYAFEPEPFNYRLLARTAARPEFAGKIVTRQCAVGAEEGTVGLWLNLRHHADHRVMTAEFRESHPAAEQISVPLVSVDAFLSKHPGSVSFVKMDVQGFEQQVCEGMKGTIAQNPGLTILLEYDPAGMRVLGFDPPALIRFLTDRGFRCQVLGAKGSLHAWPAAGMDESGYVDLLFSRLRHAAGSLV
jgi:FkbM family methyltransferase